MRFRTFACALAIACGNFAADLAQAKPSRAKKAEAAAADDDSAQERKPGSGLALPAPLSQICVGGSGKYLVVFMPKVTQVAVIDVAEKKIIKQITVEDSDSLVAASESKFVVLQRGKEVLGRYSLASGERELTVAAKGYTTLAMGASSDGPLLAANAGFEMIDLDTLKPIGSKVLHSGTHVDQLAAAADGELFSCGEYKRDVLSLVILEVAGDRLHSETEHAKVGVAVPSADGHVIYTSVGKFKPDGKTVDGHKHNKATGVLLPATTGPLYLSIDVDDIIAAKGSQLTSLKVHSQNDGKVLLTAGDLTLPDIPSSASASHIDRMRLDRRLFLLPEVESLVSIPATLDELDIQHFSVREQLDKAGGDYFFVLSSPPTKVHRGQKLSYTIDVMSNQMKVSFKLDSGPKGMTVSAKGVLSWQVPVNYAEKSAVAVVNIGDGSGTDLTHTVKLAIGAEASTRVARNSTDRSRPERTRPSTRPKSGTARETLTKNDPPSGEKSTDKSGDSADGPAAAPPPGDVVELPASATRIIVGGSGKYLLALLPSLKHVAIIDVAAKKVAKLVPTEEANVLVAAGETRFVIYRRDKGTISRYKLPSGEHELTVPRAASDILAMGSSSEGPLLSRRTQIELVDLETLEPYGTAVNIPILQADAPLFAAADSKHFGYAIDKSHPTSVYVFEVAGDQLLAVQTFIAGGQAHPGPSGQVIYTSAGRFDWECRPLDKRALNPYGRHLIPAATGPFYLTWTLGEVVGKRVQSIESLTVHHQNDQEPMFTPTDVWLPDHPQMNRPADNPKTPPEERLYLLPAVNALVAVPSDRKQLVVQHFVIKEELDKRGNDYFYVVSMAPTRLKRGEKLSYPIEVLSKRGNVKFTLASGPPQMTVSAKGLVSWDVPADLPKGEVVAIVNIRDDSGKELTHPILLNDSVLKAGVIAAQPNKGGPPRVPGEVAIAGVPTASNPAKPRAAEPAVPLRAPSTATQPEADGDNQWRWTGPKPVFVRDERGQVGGMLSADKIFLLDADGTPQPDAIAMPQHCLFAALRPGQIVALALKPTRIEILDRSGQQIRLIKLDDAKPIGCALHPHKPICYVALDREVNETRGIFFAVDEQTGSVTRADDHIGQGLEVDPSGRFLVASYFKSIYVGDELVLTQDKAPPGRVAPNQPPRPGSPRGRGPSRGGPSRGGPPASGGAIHLGIRHEYANMVLALVYDLTDPLTPSPYALKPLTKMGAGQFRLSYDGRRLSSFGQGSRQAKYLACDVLDDRPSSTSYDLPASADHRNLRSDLVFHPLLPIAIVAGGGAIGYLDTSDGKPIAGKQPTIIPQWDGKLVERATISTSGKQVVILATAAPNDNYLVRSELPLTPQELTAMQERATAPPQGMKDRTAPLAELTALGGGLAKDKKTAEIVADYSDAVVIVRTESSTGSGFIVGTSGLVLTCAHCVSPLEKTEVIYHPQGKLDEKKTVEATIIRRDRKVDLALLRIEVPDKLHSVVLADPVDVKGGEEVTIIANPGLGREVLDNTVTTGIVSNAKRTIEGNSYIQSSAAVNPGSSGGAMFDRQGRVIGVVVLKAGIEGVGFAVPPVPIATFLLKAASREGADGQLARKWIDAAGGREVEARLMGIDTDSVTLAKTGGKPQKRPRNTFSAGDQKLLELLSPADANKSTAAKPETPSSGAANAGAAKPDAKKP